MKIKKLTVLVLLCTLILQLSGCSFQNSAASKIETPSFDSLPADTKTSYTYSDQNKNTAAEHSHCDKNYVYFYLYDKKDSTVFYRIKNGTNKPQKLFTILAFTETDIDTGEKESCPTVLYNIIVHNNYIIFYNGKKDTLYKITTDGKNLSPLIRNGKWTDYASYDYGLNAVNGKVLLQKTDKENRPIAGEIYLASLDKLTQGISPTSNEKLPVLPKEKNYEYWYVLANQGVYVAAYPKYPLESGDRVLFLSAQRKIICRSFFITNDYIYYTIDNVKNNQSELWRCNLRGESTEHLSNFDTILDEIYFCDYDKDYIYLLTYKSTDDTTTCYLQLSKEGQIQNIYKNDLLEAEDGTLQVFDDKVYSFRYVGNHTSGDFEFTYLSILTNKGEFITEVRP